MSPKTTGEFISSLRKEKNMTQKQLSEKLNISDKAISKWETGRGYPDIESLMALSREFSVSINELLYGKRIDAPATAQTAEKDIADSYIKINAKKQRIRGLSIVLAVVGSILAILVVLLFSAFYKEVMGSPNCVIASDYSYMTLFGERYVPLILGNADCEPTECLIDEARVEGAPFIVKLFFSDSVYSVKQCANNELVYLQTDYDNLISDYYCMESKVDEYRRILQESSYDKLIAEIITKDWNRYDLQLNDELAQMITTSNYQVSPEVNCDWARGEGDESIVICISQTEGPFRRAEGELIRKQGEYYWFDYDDIHATQHHGDFSRIDAYEIDNSYDKDLDVLFSYMFQ